MGRIDHAIDVNSLDGGASRLAAWLQPITAPHPTFPVPGEPWHIEVPAGELARAGQETARIHCASTCPTECRDDPRVRPAPSSAGGVNRDERVRIRPHLMKAQRKLIWRAAQPTSHGGDGRGWEHANRRARYESLLARTK